MEERLYDTAVIHSGPAVSDGTHLTKHSWLRANHAMKLYHEGVFHNDDGIEFKFNHLVHVKSITTTGGKMGTLFAHADKNVESILIQPYSVKKSKSCTCVS
jgi:hypothetical protein